MHKQESSSPQRSAPKPTQYEARLSAAETNPPASAHPPWGSHLISPLLIQRPLTRRKSSWYHYRPLLGKDVRNKPPPVSTSTPSYDTFRLQDETTNEESLRPCHERTVRVVEHQVASPPAKSKTECQICSTETRIKSMTEDDEPLLGMLSSRPLRNIWIPAPASLTIQAIFLSFVHFPAASDASSLHRWR